MPKKGSSETITRQWRILQSLPTRGPGISAKDLESALRDKGYVVSRRTIERDLNLLSTLFPIECNDKGKPYGWRWAKDADLNLGALTVPEALSLQLVADHIQSMVPVTMLDSLQSRFDQARRTLDANAGKKAEARWADKIRQVPPVLPLSPPSIDPDVLSKLHDALLRERQIEVEYRSVSEKEVKSLILHPLGLVLRGNATYLVATTFYYPDPRIYAVHRIERLEITGQTINMPQGFSLDDYVESGAMQFGLNGEIELEAWLDDWVANLLEETPINDSQTIDWSDNGEGAILRVTVKDTWQLRAWLLSRGSGIVVHAPEPLREWLRETVTTMSRQYDACATDMAS